MNPRVAEEIFRKAPSRSDVRQWSAEASLAVDANFDYGVILEASY